MNAQELAVLRARRNKMLLRIPICASLMVSAFWIIFWSITELWTGAGFVPPVAGAIRFSNEFSYQLPFLISRWWDGFGIAAFSVVAILAWYYSERYKELVNCIAIAIATATVAAMAAIAATATAVATTVAIVIVAIVGVFVAVEDRYKDDFMFLAIFNAGLGFGIGFGAGVCSYGLVIGLCVSAVLSFVYTLLAIVLFSAIFLVKTIIRSRVKICNGFVNWLFARKLGENKQPEDKPKPAA